MLQHDRNQQWIRHLNVPWVICIGLILIIGLLNLYSATYGLSVAKYFKAQVLWLGVSLLVVLLMSLFDYKLLFNFAYGIYAMTIVSLVLVFFVGKVSQGAQRWISIGGFNIQPSEIAKIGIVIGLARYFHDHRSRQDLSLSGLFIPMGMTLVPFVLILKQPDLGTALVLSFTSVGLLYFMGIKQKIMLVSMVVFIVSMPLAWKFALRPYQKDRVITFLEPEKFASGKGYQVIQSKIAIGSGELFGKGYLKGTQSKLQFLPKQHTDFIFSNFAEEFGFLGSFVLIVLYGAMTFIGINVALRSRDIFGMILALGSTFILTFQALINFAMECGLLPVVGMTLPLFSYGGSSLVISMMAAGLILNVSKSSHMF